MSENSDAVFVRLLELKDEMRFLRPEVTRLKNVEEELKVERLKLSAIEAVIDDLERGQPGSLELQEAGLICERVRKNVENLMRKYQEWVAASKRIDSLVERVNAQRTVLNMIETKMRKAAKC